MKLLHLNLKNFFIYNINYPQAFINELATASALIILRQKTSHVPAVDDSTSQLALKDLMCC